MKHILLVESCPFPLMATCSLLTRLMTFVELIISAYQMKVYGEEFVGDGDARAATSCFVEGGLDHLKNID